MLVYFALLGLAGVTILGADRWAVELRRAWRYVRPYRGMYELRRPAGYQRRHFDPSILGTPQCPGRLIRSEL
jgi:hypothetical protein